jgi:nicotinate-nucleotide adenylyltransferase
VPKQKSKQKKTAKQAKPAKSKTALKPSRIKKPINAARPAKAKTSAKPAKSAKPASRTKPAKSAKTVRSAKLAKQATKSQKKANKAAKKIERKQGRSQGNAERRERSDVRPSKRLTPEEKAARLPLASPRMRIGLLGGSFNPAHAAHVEISLTALKRLGLDQVWWVVTPSNPLKVPAELPSLTERVSAARKVANHPRIAVTGFPGEKGSPYTVDLITELKRRYPGVSFVWLMGADSLAEFNRWRSWHKIFAKVPIAVLDRPGFRLKARASQAAMRFHDFIVDESDARGLARMLPPAWTIMTHRLSPLSSTALRGEARARKAGDKKTKKKR